MFATNGALFAFASALPPRQLRHLSATYGAAYTSFAKTASSGNLTGVNPASHPSSYVTAQSTSLGDVGSIIFETDGLVAVVTRIADKVLLAAVGPSQLEAPETESLHHETRAVTGDSPTGSTTNGLRAANGTVPQQPSGGESPPPPPQGAPSQHVNEQRRFSDPDAELQAQYEIDKSSDLARLAALNLPASPAILLALESKSAALGKFLGQKLEDLEFPDDF